MQETEFKAVTQEAMIEEVTADLTPRNAEQLLLGADVVLDGTDNLETRFLINDVALKILTGAEPRQSLLRIDVWAGEFLELSVRPRPECPACGRGRYEYLAGSHTSYTTVLCGRNAVQITPPRDHDISLDQLQERLGRVGKTSFNGFLLTFEAEGRGLTLFPTGRAVIRGTTDEAEARTLYAKYLGL